MAGMVHFDDSFVALRSFCIRMGNSARFSKESAPHFYPKPVGENDDSRKSIIDESSSNAGTCDEKIRRSELSASVQVQPGKS